MEATSIAQPAPTPRRSGRPDKGGRLRDIMQTIFEEEVTGQDYTWMELESLRPQDRFYGA